MELNKKNISNQNLVPWIGADKRVVAVIGDIMLDEYLVGQVNRISPEAPVPVHLVTETIHRPGGAANAALNVCTLGGYAKLYSVMGEDEAGRHLRRIFKESNIDDSMVLALIDRPTIRKTRVTSGVQQLIRVDWEKSSLVSDQVIDQFLRDMTKSDLAAILVSDYGKGLLTDYCLRSVIKLAQEKGIPVLVDPKRKDFKYYEGATLITPNRKEACEALDLAFDGPETGEDLAESLQKKYKLANILVTLGSKGMLLSEVPAENGVPEKSFPKKGSLHTKNLYLRATAKEVFDVSGAGDTVVAAMSLAAAHGVDFKEGAMLANAAAAIAVGKIGTQPVYLEELLKSLNQDTPVREALGKIYLQEQVGEQIGDYVRRVLSERQGVKKDRQARIVFTNGCFDILHAGHVRYLQDARKLGDILVVGINSDESIKRLKGPQRPINSLMERMEVLAGLECVDIVVSFDADHPLDLIKSVRPTLLVKGGDYNPEASASEPTAIIGADFVRSLGGAVKVIPLVPGISTSGIVHKIIARQVP